MLCSHHLVDSSPRFGGLLLTSTPLNTRRMGTGMPVASLLCPSCVNVCFQIVVTHNFGSATGRIAGFTTICSIGTSFSRKDVDCCVALARAEVAAVWEKQHYGGTHNRKLTIDSSADWNSTLATDSAAVAMVHMLSHDLHRCDVIEVHIPT